MPETHRDEIEKLEALYASNPAGRVFTHLAEAYRKAGELARAREILDGGLARHPDYPSAHVVLGRVLLDFGEEEAAVAAFRRVLELDRHNLVALRALGDLAVEAGRFEEARHYFGELILIDPADLEIAERLDTLPAEPSLADIPPEPEEIGPAADPVSAGSPAEIGAEEREAGDGSAEPDAAASAREPAWPEAVGTESGDEAGWPGAGVGEPEAAADTGEAVEAAAGAGDESGDEVEGALREPAPLAAWVETLSVLDADIELPELPPMEPAPPMTWPDPAESAAATSPDENAAEASGTVESDVEARMEPGLEGEGEVTADAEHASQPAQETEPEAGAERSADPELEAEPELSIEPELQVETELQVEAEAGVEPEPGARSEPELEAEPVVGAGAWLEAEPELEASSGIEPEVEPEVAEPEPLVDSEVVAEPPAMVSDAILEPDEDARAVESEVPSGTDADGDLTVSEADLESAWWGDPELHESVPEPVEWVSQEDWEQIAAYGTWVGADEAENEVEAVPPVADDWGSDRDEDADEVATETLAEVYAAQGFRAEAAEIYRKLLRRRPEDERLLSRLAALEKEPVEETAEAGSEVTVGEEAGAADLWVEDGETWPGGEEQAEAGPTPYAWLESGAPTEAASGGTIGDRLRGILGWQPEAAPVEDLEPESEPESEAMLLLEDVAVEPVLPDFPVFRGGDAPGRIDPGGRDTESEEDLEMFRSWLKSLRK